MADMAKGIGREKHGQVAAQKLADKEEKRNAQHDRSYLRKTYESQEELDAARSRLVRDRVINQTVQKKVDKTGEAIYRFLMAPERQGKKSKRVTLSRVEDVNLDKLSRLHQFSKRQVEIMASGVTAWHLRMTSKQVFYSIFDRLNGLSPEECVREEEIMKREGLPVAELEFTVRIMLGVPCNICVELRDFHNVLASMPLEEAIEAHLAHNEKCKQNHLLSVGGENGLTEQVRRNIRRQPTAAAAAQAEEAADGPVQANNVKHDAHRIRVIGHAEHEIRQKNVVLDTTASVQREQPKLANTLQIEKVKSLTTLETERIKQESACELARIKHAHDEEVMKLRQEKEALEEQVKERMGESIKLTEGERRQLSRVLNTSRLTSTDLMNAFKLKAHLAREGKEISDLIDSYHKILITCLSE
jgi:hypothetical protein